MAAAVLLTVGAAAGCSSNAAPPAPSPGAAPRPGGTTTTWRYFSRSTGVRLNAANGTRAPQQAAPAVGEYMVSTGIDYQGDAAHHTLSAAGSDHLVCTVVSASGTGLNAQCYAEVDLGGSLLTSDHQGARVQGDGTDALTLAISGGTGQYRGLHGTLRISPAGRSGDADLSITVSGKASGPAPTATPPTIGAGMSTRSYYSMATSQSLYSPQGRPVADPRVPPVVGDYLVSTGVTYTGDHGRHDNAPVGSEHLVCVVTSMSSGGAVGAQCFAQLALGRSMVVADHQEVRFVGRDPYVTLNLTGGTGEYQGAHGTLRVAPMPGSTSADLVLSAGR